MKERHPLSGRAVIFGAQGAIGAALTDCLDDTPAIEIVYCGARNGACQDGSKQRAFDFDLLDERSIAVAAAQIGSDGPVDLVLVATGALHGDAMQPEKTWRDFSASQFERMFAINATGPALIAKHFLPLLSKERRSIFAALSARVGSIEDNRLGGWASYRASKAALHQIIRTCAVELARKNPKALCVALHPGTVDSALSKPFQRSATHGVFSPEESARHLIDVLERLASLDSGCAFAWDGAKIPF